LIVFIMGNAGQVPEEPHLHNRSDSGLTSSSMQVDQDASQTPAFPESDQSYRSAHHVATGPMLVDPEAKRHPLEDSSELPNYDGYQSAVPLMSKVSEASLYHSSYTKGARFLIGINLMMIVSYSRDA